MLKFRHLLEKHKLSEQLFAEVSRVLQASGMKLHIGVDSESELARSAVVTAANVHDKHALPQLLLLLVQQLR